MNSLTEDLFVSEVPASQFRDNPDSALDVYEQGKMGLIRIKPDYDASEDFRDVAKAVVRNIGNYKPNDTTILRTHLNSVDMCMAVYEAIESTGGRVYIIPVYMEKILDFLLKGMTDNEKAKTFFQKYGKAFQAADHWTMTYARSPFTLSKETNENKKHYDAYSLAFSKLFDERMGRGELASWDMIHCPQPREAENVGMDFETYQNIIFRAMKIDVARLVKKERKFALKKFGYEIRPDIIMGKNGKFRVSLGETDLTFCIEGRQIISEGPPGTNYFQKKKAPEVITNHPTGEAFVSPIESSVNGKLVTNIPKFTQTGVVRSLSATIQNGMVVSYDTPDEEIFKKTFSGSPERTVGEIGFAGELNEKTEVLELFNRELEPIKETGKTTGVAIIDEKVYPMHVALGSNTMWGGVNEALVHEDFSIPEEINGKKKILIIEHIL